MHCSAARLLFEAFVRLGLTTRCHTVSRQVKPQSALTDESCKTLPAERPWKIRRDCGTVPARNGLSDVKGNHAAHPGPGVSESQAAMTRQTYSSPRRPLLVTVNDRGQTAIVMIGPIRGPEHLALIHALRFYHVPVSAIAASRTEVGFVAFYEPASRFRAVTGVIREFAEVVRVSRTQRRDLPGLTWPGRGNDETPYYRFDLGPVLSLPQPITNPEHLRVVFRFPDIERFRRATNVRELGRGDPGASRPPRSKSPAVSSGSRKRIVEESKA